MAAVALAVIGAALLADTASTGTHIPLAGPHAAGGRLAGVLAGGAVVALDARGAHPGVLIIEPYANGPLRIDTVGGWVGLFADPRALHFRRNVVKLSTGIASTWAISGGFTQRFARGFPIGHGIAVVTDEALVATAIGAITAG
jgi:hypothetical protein